MLNFKLLTAASICTMVVSFNANAVSDTDSESSRKPLFSINTTARRAPNFTQNTNGTITIAATASRGAPDENTSLLSAPNKPRYSENKATEILELIATKVDFGRTTNPALGSNDKNQNTQKFIEKIGGLNKEILPHAMRLSNLIWNLTEERRTLNLTWDQYAESLTQIQKDLGDHTQVFYEVMLRVKNAYYKNNDNFYLDVQNFIEAYSSQIKKRSEEERKLVLGKLNKFYGLLQNNKQPSFGEFKKLSLFSVVATDNTVEKKAVLNKKAKENSNKITSSFFEKFFKKDPNKN